MNDSATKRAFRALDGKSLVETPNQSFSPAGRQKSRSRRAPQCRFRGAPEAEFWRWLGRFPVHGPQRFTAKVCEGKLQSWIPQYVLQLGRSLGRAILHVAEVNIAPADCRSGTTVPRSWPPRSSADSCKPFLAAYKNRLRNIEKVCLRSGFLVG